MEWVLESTGRAAAVGEILECIDEPDRTIPEDVVIRARVDEIKKRTFTWMDGKSDPPVEKETTVREWWFEVTDGEHKGRRVKGQTDVQLGNGSRNKLRQWIEAILDRDIAVGARLDIDDLVGLPVDITIRHKADKKDPSKKYEEVDGVIGVSASDGWGQVPF